MSVELVRRATELTSGDGLAALQRPDAASVERCQTD